MTATKVMVVDTNVWLDYLFGDRSRCADARDFLMQAVRTDTPLVIAPHCLSDVFFIFQQQLKLKNREGGMMSPDRAAASARAAAWAALDFILEYASVGPTDHMDALVASKHRAIHGDYEDNLVISCALRTEARLLVTNDEKLIKHSPAPAMTAKDAAALLSLE